MGNTSAKDQAKLTNAKSNELFNQSESMLPGIESGWAQVMSPLNATDTAAIKQAGEGATGQSYASAANQAANRAAASNNPVGQLALQDSLARSKGTAMGDAALKDQATIDAMNQQRKETGLAGLSGIESGLQNTGLGYSGQATSSTNQEQASAFNWGNFLDSLVQGGAKVGAAALASGGGGG